MSHRKRHQPIAGVAYTRHAGVAHHGDVVAAFEMHDQLSRAGKLIVLVIADGGLLDAVVVQQLHRLPGIFAGDEVHVLQGPQCAQRDVFQIADRCADEVKRAGGNNVVVADSSGTLEFFCHCAQCSTQRE